MNKQIDLCPANPKSKFEHILLYKGLQKSENLRWN